MIPLLPTDTKVLESQGNPSDNTSLKEQISVSRDKRPRVSFGFLYRPLTCGLVGVMKAWRPKPFLIEVSFRMVLFQQTYIKMVTYWLVKWSCLGYKVERSDLFHQSDQNGTHDTMWVCNMKRWRNEWGLVQVLIMDYSCKQGMFLCMCCDRGHNNWRLR